jgi:hypothetical protein
MWTRVILYTLSGFAALALIFTIVFSRQITDIAERSYYFDNPSQALWEKTLGNKLSLLREKVSLCSIRGGKKIRINEWSAKHAKFKCHLPYSDRGAQCNNSDQCQGECLITSPTIDYNTYINPSRDPVLKKFNCMGVGGYAEWPTRDGKTYVHEKYVCEKSFFTAHCSAFEWDKYNQWEINNETINYFDDYLGIEYATDL